jgi:hypothetical protein
MIIRYPYQLITRTGKLSPWSILVHRYSAAMIYRAASSLPSLSISYRTPTVNVLVHLKRRESSALRKTGRRVFAPQAIVV